MQNPSTTKLAASLAVRLGLEAGNAESSGGIGTPGDMMLELLRDGQETRPLFCFPPLGALHVIYRNLLDRLPPGEAAFGLRMQEVPGNGKRPTLSEVAAAYASAIRAQQGQGPYHLLGFSAGGYFAMATARALEAQQEEVRFVALLDSDIRWTDPALPRQRMFEKLLSEVEQLIAQSRPGASTTSLTRPGALAELVSRVLAGSSEERIELTASWLRRLATERVDVPSDVRAFATVLHAQIAMLEDVRLEPGQAPLLIWSTQETLADGFGSVKSWSTYTKTGTVETAVPGGHYGLMAMPAVGEVAARLSSIWQDLEAGAVSFAADSEASRIV